MLIAPLQAPGCAAGSLRRETDGAVPAGRRIARAGQDVTVPVMLSEFGGIAFSRERTRGYAVVSDADEFRDGCCAR